MVRVYRHGIHRGEEPQIAGNERAGMVVFSGCHLRCSFCYTPEASFEKQGEDLDLDSVFTQLAEQGARNLNLITPSHIWEKLKAPLQRFRQNYPSLPIVLKVTGFEGMRLAREFAAYADVVVMDFKVFHPESAKQVNLPVSYGAVATRFLETLQSKLPLKRDAEGKIRSGIVIRTLWLPMAGEEGQAIASTLLALRFSGVWNLMTLFLDSEKHRLVSAPKDWVLDLQAQCSGASFQIWKDGKEAVGTQSLGRVG